MLGSLVLALTAFNPCLPDAQPISPDIGNLNDLSFLAEKMKGVDLVQLGEATHGAAEMYQLKTKFVKYLHEKLNFDTLVFEAGCMETTLAFQSRQDLSADQLMDATMFTHMRCRELQPLFEYLKRNKSIRVLGCDPQFSSDEVLSLVSNSIKPYDAQLATEVHLNLGAGYQYMGLVDKPELFRQKRKEYLAWLDHATSRLKKIVPARGDKSKIDFIVSALLDLREYWNYEPTTPVLDRYAKRDQIMANLILKYCSKGKTIVWAHNGHLGSGLGYKIVGDYLRESMKSRTYSIGMFAQKGKFLAHWNQSTPNWQARADGLEAQFPAQGFAWFRDSGPFSQAVAAYEPENGGIISFAPKSRFDGLVVLTKLNPITKRK